MKGIKGNTVYVLSVWSVSKVDLNIKEVLVFADEQSAHDYIAKSLNLYWYEDGYGNIVKETYTLVETGVL